MQNAVQIDVVTPASSYNLIDLATLKTLLNQNDGTLDAYLDEVIPQASSSVADYCNNPFVIEAIQSTYYPTRDGWPWVVRNGRAPLQLKRYPLTAVASVVETISGVPTTLVVNTDYLVDNEKGQLTRLDTNGWPTNWRANPIAVSFSAGYSAIPSSVVNAVVAVIKAILYARNRDPGLRGENVEGVYSAQYWSGAGPDAVAGLPYSITGPLDKYRVPVIG